NSEETATAATQTTPNPISHQTTSDRDDVREGRTVPAVCQARIARPETTAAGTGVPSPMARTTPIAARPAAMTCWPISIARTVGPDGAGPTFSTRDSGLLTRLMCPFCFLGILVRRSLRRA